MDSVYFVASKIVWPLISPDSLLLLLSLLGLLCLYLNKISYARILLSVSILSLTFIAVLPIHEWIALPLENRFSANPDLPDEIDGIIVLGGSVAPERSYYWDQVEINSRGERLIAFLNLGRRFPNAKLIFSGGSGGLSNQDLKEADIARIFFLEQGIPANRIIFERNSRNTYENVFNSKALVQPGPDEKWILVTSAMHMPRSVGLFCQQDWSVIPYPVDHNTSPGAMPRIEFMPASNLGALSNTIREWVGLVAHRLAGKTSSLLPGSC